MSLSPTTPVNFRKIVDARTVLTGSAITKIRCDFGAGYLRRVFLLICDNKLRNSKELRQKMGGLFSDRAKQAFGQAFGDAWGDVERNQELDISVLFGSILAVLCPPGEREIL